MEILSSFELEENHSSSNTIRIINKSNENEENYSDSHASTYIFKLSDSSELSKALLAMLIDLKVIQTEETNQIILKVKAYLKSVLFCVLFLISCVMNVPIFALYVPFTLSFHFISATIFIFVICWISTVHCEKHLSVFVHNIFACIVFGILCFVFWKIEFWISILIAIYTIFWPIILNDFLVFLYRLDYGVVSLTFELWKKIDFGFIRFLHCLLNIAGEKRPIKIINPFLKVIFNLIHSPFILLYYIFFIPMLSFLDSNSSVKCILTFYTNFTLSLCSFVGGCYLLYYERDIVYHSSQIPTEAIVLFIISFYIFFFLCICHNYCWRNFNMTYGILTSQVKKINNICKHCKAT